MTPGLGPPGTRNAPGREQLARAVHLGAAWILLTVVALALSGCMSAGGGMGGFNPRRLAGRTASEAPLVMAPPVLAEDPGQVITTEQLFAIYQLVIENYVDRVDHRVLIEGALQGFHEGVDAEALLPMDGAVVEGAPLRFSQDPQRDWDQFGSRYDTFLDKLATRIGVGAVGEATARGMLASLNDPHTAFLDKRAVEAMQATGVVGIGVILSAPDQRGEAVIREVVAGGPAAHAELRPGDRIMAVDGRATGPMRLDEATDQIRGVEGTDVILQIRSARDGRIRDVRLTRAAVPLPAVQGEPREGVGYLRIRRFEKGVAEATRAELQRLAQLGVLGWVLDLRGNRGGDIDEVVEVASLFVGDRTVGLRVDRAQRPTPLRGTGPRLTPPLPIAVLIDQDAASGAEVLAAALKENQAGTLIGVTTSGRVGLASLRELRDGSAVQLTFGRILSPTGAQLNGVGVEPDIVVGSTIDDWIQGRDPQLERAISQLQAATARGGPAGEEAA